MAKALHIIGAGMAGSEAAWQAANKGSADALKLLLAARADATTPNNKGETPLQSARRRNATICEEIILAASQQTV